MTVRVLKDWVIAMSFVLGCSTANADEFSIASFNTYWFYDDVAPHESWRTQRTRCDRPQRPCEASYDQTVDVLSDAVVEIDADILVLQEVESGKVVADLASALANKGLSYPHIFVGQGTDPFTGQDVAVLSKFPNVIEPILRYPAALEDYSEDRYGAPRIAALPKFMRVDLDVEGSIVTIFGAHLKSQRGGESAEEERLAQARLVRRITRAATEKGDSRSPSFVAIVGDLNDDIGSPTLRTLRGLNDGSFDLKQTSSAIEEDQRYTHEFCARYKADGTCAVQVEREQLDHTLANRFLHQRMTSFEIIRIPSAISDHDVVKATFDLGSGEE